MKSKISYLEEKNLNLEQELSSYRILHLDYDKEKKVKEKKDDKEKGDKLEDKNNLKENNDKMNCDEKKNEVTRNNLISKTRYEETYKNIVSPES